MATNNDYPTIPTGGLNSYTDKINIRFTSTSITFLAPDEVYDGGEGNRTTAARDIAECTFNEDGDNYYWLAITIE